MKIIDLVCPNCNGAIHLDEDKEFGFCMHCGHQIALTGDDVGNNRFNQIKRLKTTLGVKIQTRNQTEIIGLCDRIIELDPDDSDAWYYKGLYALQKGLMSEALPYWNKSVDGMTKDRARELQECMVETLANALFSDEESSIPIGYIWSLSKKMDCKTDFADDDESTDFLIELIAKMIHITNETDDPFEICYNVNTIMIITLNLAGYYMDILTQRDLFSEVIEALTEIYNKMGNKSFFGLTSTNHEKNEVSKNIAFISRIVSEIDATLESHTESELDQLYCYWVENETTDFVDFLFEAYGADIEIANAGMLSISKLKNERRAKIQAYLDSYFEPLKRGLC